MIFLIKYIFLNLQNILMIIRAVIIVIPGTPVITCYGLNGWPYWHDFSIQLAKYGLKIYFNHLIK